MITLIGIILIVITALLVVVVLIQNPKGGGLSSSFGAASNQFMDVKRTGDFLEKSTWVFFACLIVLCLSSNAVITSGDDGETSKTGSEFVDKQGAKAQKQQPAQPAATPAPDDTV